MRYPHLFSRLYNTPLLLHPDKASVIESVFRAHATSIDLAKPEAVAAGPGSGSSARDDKPYQLSSGGVAIIPVMGTLVQRASGLDAMSGMTSYSSVSRLIDAAIQDRDVNSILLEMDSPGGEVSGLYDIADSIYAAREQKPIWAIANEQAYSAAYAIASSAAKLYMPRTAGVGSIGVIAMHVDQSKRDATQGYTYTAIYAGDKKNDFNSHAPLSDSATADLQAEIDRLYTMFVDTVARNRGISAQVVKDTQAGVMNPQQATELGFADGIATLAEVVSMMETEFPKSHSTTALLAKNRKETQMSSQNAPAGVSAEQQAIAIEQATQAGRKAGAQAERERIGAILQSEESKGREAMAQTFALETDMDAATANKLLAKSPVATSAASTADTGFSAAMAGIANPKVGAGGDENPDQSPEAEAAAIAQKILGAGKPVRAK